MKFEDVIEQQFKDKIPNINSLLAFATENRCSDLYVKAGSKPYFGRFGGIYEIPCMAVNNLAWNEFANEAISSENNAKYVRDRMLDFSHSIDVPDDSKFRLEYSLFRYRVSAGFSETRNTATFRMITPDNPSFSNIVISPIVQEAIRESFKTRTGIIILAGPTGSGKTTTLAACMNDFTKPEQVLSNSMIITLEDPIEYIYPSNKNVRIMQKELGRDFRSFPLGMKQALREKPTHLLCGEIRDREGINVCVEASRTGHKVITTFHSQDVAGVLGRILSYASNGGDSQEVMFDIISNLSFILCQRMVSNGNEPQIQTQYMLFTDDIKEVLHKVVIEGLNVYISINSLFKNKGLVDSGIVKNWS